MLNKQDIYRLLDEESIWHEITGHPAAYNMADLAAIPLPYPSADAKNLFVRDDNKRNYYLLTVRGDRRVDLREFRSRYGTKRLSFASEGDMLELLGLHPGSVTPLGLLNDAEHRVIFYLDAFFLEPPALIGVHPNENTATVWMKTDDLLRLLRTTGADVRIAEF